LVFAGHVPLTAAVVKTGFPTTSGGFGVRIVEGSNDTFPVCAGVCQKPVLVSLV
jgi:hypothetical protein